MLLRAALPSHTESTAGQAISVFTRHPEPYLGLGPGLQPEDDGHLLRRLVIRQHLYRYSLVGCPVAPGLLGVDLARKVESVRRAVLNRDHLLAIPVSLERHIVEIAAQLAHRLADILLRGLRHSSL